MSAQYREGAKNPPTKYEQLKDTTCYSCNAPCTCKYLNNRTEYDQMQFERIVQGKNVHYQKVKSYLYK